MTFIFQLTKQTDSSLNAAFACCAQTFCHNKVVSGTQRPTFANTLTAFQLLIYVFQFLPEKKMSQTSPSNTKNKKENKAQRPLPQAPGCLWQADAPAVQPGGERHAGLGLPPVSLEQAEGGGQRGGRKGRGGSEG